MPDDYESVALSWLHRETSELIEELKRSKVDTATSRLIAGNFMFGLACRLDGAEGDGAAELCFRTPHGLLRREKTVSLHDYILGTVDELLGL